MSFFFFHCFFLRKMTRDAIYRAEFKKRKTQIETNCFVSIPLRIFRESHFQHFQLHMFFFVHILFLVVVKASGTIMSKFAQYCTENLKKKYGNTLQIFR